MRNYINTLSFSINWVTINKQNILRAILITSVILVSALLPLLTSQRQRLVIVVLLLGSGAILVILRWLPLGLLMIPVVGMFVPFVGPGGINGSILLVISLFGLWIFDMVVRQRKIQIKSSITNLPLFIFIIISLISYGFGQIHWYPFVKNAPQDAQFGGLVIYLASIGAFLLVANLIHDLRWLKLLTWLYLVIGGIYIVCLISGLGMITILFETNAISGSLFYVWLVALSSSQAIFNKQLPIVFRILLAFIALAAIYTMYTYEYRWRSGYLPPLTSLIAVVAFYLGKRLWLLVPLLPLLTIVTRDYLSRVITEERYSWVTRLEAWKVVYEISKINPLSGLGFANYYWYAPLFPILGYQIRFNSHSQYIDLIAQIGFIGLLCFFWMFFVIGKLGWSLLALELDGFSKAYVFGALGGIIGTLVAGAFVDWILPFVYNIGMEGFRASVFAWMFMGGLVVIEHSARSQTKPR